MSRKIPAHVITDDSALGGSVIQRSLRFNDNDSAYLSRTPSSAGNRKTWTWSAWIKRGSLGSRQILFSADDNVTYATYLMLEFQSDDNLRALAGTEAAAGTLTKETAAVIRDTTSWYHLVFKFDAANTSAVWYINGEEITDLNASTNPANQDFQVNATSQHFLGRFGSSLGTSYFDGYMAEVNFVDGQALDASYFGYTESQTGLWRPKRYEGTYGTNGFHLDFLDNSSTSALGIDKSPNGNDFTLNNFSESDCVLDAPSNNFATWNVLDAEGKDNSSSFSEGSLKVQIAYQGDDEESGATLAFSSGKWYWEEYMQSSTNNSAFVGVGVKSVEGIYANGGNHWRVRGGGGESDHNGSQTNVSGLSWTNGDIIGIAVDMDAGTWTVSKNGTFIGANIHTNLSGTVTPVMHNSNGSERHTFITNFGQDSSFAGTKTAQGNKDANGIGDFYYPVPSGYKALCSKNLPPNSPSIIRPQKHFETLLYTGTGSSNIVEGLEFSPDMIWVKGRDTNGYEHMIIDSVRGGTKSVVPNSTDAESTHGGRSMTFYPGGVRWNSDSGNCNANGEDYVMWCWKAGGAAVTNTDGTINTQVSVNEEAGFSIATYTGNGATTATIGHGLGKTPAWIIIKNRSSSADWVVMHEGIGSYDGGNYKHQPIKLNSTGAKTSILGIWQTPNSSTQQISDGQTSGSNRPLTNTSGDNYVAYFWAEIPGFSKFGSYTGNGSDDGPFINLGFRPAWIMFKLADGGADDWPIYDIKRDPINVCDHRLFANTSTAEGAVGQEHFDILSNGIKFRKQKNPFNNSGKVYIYMAFAEQPGTTPFGTLPNAR